MSRALVQPRSHARYSLQPMSTIGNSICILCRSDTEAEFEGFENEELIVPINDEREFHSDLASGWRRENETPLEVTRFNESLIYIYILDCTSSSQSFTCTWINLLYTSLSFGRPFKKLWNDARWVSKLPINAAGNRGMFATMDVNFTVIWRVGGEERAERHWKWLVLMNHLYILDCTSSSHLSVVHD